MLVKLRPLFLLRGGGKGGRFAEIIVVYSIVSWLSVIRSQVHSIPELTIPCQSSAGITTMTAIYLEQVLSLFLLCSLLHSAFSELRNTRSKQRSVSDQSKIDCYPEMGASRASCQSRGCTWEEISEKVTQRIDICKVDLILFKRCRMFFIAFLSH